MTPSTAGVRSGSVRGRMRQVHPDEQVVPPRTGRERRHRGGRGPAAGGLAVAKVGLGQPLTLPGHALGGHEVDVLVHDVSSGVVQGVGTRCAGVTGRGG
ncbi:hypothetical protein [Ornithinimicrobium kibberense]|uniref:hypothetical protein n=1 Tax=Ornithinimicrobium kibberense TaxID=282060 RepID=UPI00361AACBC